MKTQFTGDGLEQKLEKLETESRRHKQKSEILQNSEKMFSTMLASLPDHISMMDKNLNIIWANDTVKNIFGENIIGRKCYEVYHKRQEPCEPYPCITLKAFQDGKNHEDYTQVVGQDGRTIDFYCSANVALHDTDGNPKTVIEIFKDITEQKRAENALRESEARHRTLTNDVLDSSAVALFILDSNFKIVWINRATEHYFRLKREEVIGKDKRQLIHSHIKNVVEDPETFCNKVLATYDDNTYIENFECHVLPGDDQEGYWLEHLSQPIKSGLYAGGRIEQYTDISERKLASDILRESEERYRSIVENSHDGILIVGEDYKFQYVNDEFCKITGRSRDELIGEDFRTVLDDDSKNLVTDRYERRQKGEDVPSKYEFNILKKDGEKRRVEISATVIKDSKGEVRTVAQLLDITLQKHLEDQLHQAQKLEAIGTLAGGIAHDFNNLLMGIQGNITLALADMHRDHPFYENLKNIEEYVKRGASVTKQLLGFARGGKYVVRVTDINKIIEQTSRMFGRTRRMITIHTEYKENLWAVEVDKNQIEQVLMNLYVNAWQAMPGGGNLYIQTDNVILAKEFVKPHKLRAGRYVKISVTDTGIGIDEKTRARIFDPFFTTKAMGSNAGLGLASVYGIVKNHEGFIEVYSEEEIGTTFIIYLPASEKEVLEEETGDEYPRHVLFGNERVLLVDDEEMIIRVGRRMLEKLGYRVLVARSGNEALDIYKSSKDGIDIVLLDMIMPGLSGRETFEELKHMDPRVKVLLSSGYTIDGEATEILNAGCNGFIQKPFDLRELSQGLRSILDT